MNRKLEQERAAAEYILANAKVVVNPQADADIAPFGATLPDSIPRGDGEDADFVVCQLINLDHEIYFDDNVITDCTRCGERIQHRPYAPKKPPKICIKCALALVEADKAKES